MTNLDHDIKRAKELGYGVHYGQYKADHPNTANGEDVKEGFIPCLECGMLFYPRRKGMVYCCKKHQERRQHRLRRQEMMEEANGKNVEK